MGLPRPRGTMPVIPQLRLNLRFAFAILALFAPVARFDAADSPTLRVVFGPRSTILSGRIASEATAEALVNAIKTARPELPPDRSGLVIAPDAPEFPAGDLKSLLAEIALSTHEGRLEIWPDRLVIGGLTDSLLTQSALRIRAEPFLGTRILQNRLCIVSTDDLPDLAVSLADGSKPGMKVTSTVEAKPRVEVSFEAPGIRLEKLPAALSLLADLSKAGAPPGSSTTPPPTGFAPLRAEPLTTAPGPASDAVTGMPIPLTATPVERLAPLTPVFFAANSFLLQANQAATLDAIAKSLLSPGYTKATVRLEAMKPSGGSSTYNEYVCERRSSEVARLLAERGVDPTIFRPDIVDSPSPIDSGEVRVTVVMPPLPDPDPSLAKPGNGSPAPAGGASPAP